MSAQRTSAARLVVREWARVRVRQQQRHRPTDHGTAADDDGVAADQRNLVVAQQRHAPRRRGWKQRRAAMAQLAGVPRAHAIDVLAGGDCARHRGAVAADRQRRLHHDAVDLRIVIELRELRQHLRLGGVGGERHDPAGDADIGGGAGERAHVAACRRIVGRMQYRQRRAAATLRGDALGSLARVSPHRARHDAPIEDHRRHAVHPALTRSTSRVTFAASSSVKLTLTPVATRKASA
jgi:hypothetical protein